MLDTCDGLASMSASPSGSREWEQTLAYLLTPKHVLLVMLSVDDSKNCYCAVPSIQPAESCRVPLTSDAACAYHLSGGADHFVNYIHRKIKESILDKATQHIIERGHWDELQTSFHSILVRAARLFSGRFPPVAPDGMRSACRHEPVIGKIFVPSESVVLEDASSISPEKRVAALRDLLAARSIRHGVSEFLSYSQTFEQRKHRLALAVLALQHEEYHTGDTVGGNDYFQGPFYSMKK